MSRALRAVAAVLAPLLLAVFPLLSLFAQNQTDVELRVLLRPLLLCLLGTAVVLALMTLATRRLSRGSVVTSLLALGFFYYGVFLSTSSAVVLVLWLLGVVLVTTVVLRWGKALPEITVLALVAGLVMVVPQVVSIVRWNHSHPSLAATDSRLWPTPLAAPVSPVSRPDIYVIVPDDYARSDVLKTYFRYDDSAFLKELTDRGFSLDTQSRSPYSDSESNIASALNMDYLSQFPKVLGESSEDVRPVKRVTADNRASRLLKAVGYEYTHLDTDEVTFAGSNPGISSLAPPDGFANLWMRKTVLHAVGGPLGFNDGATDSRYRSAVDHVFGELTKQRSSSTPQLVVFHTLLPHDPYVYAADGRPVTYDGSTDASLSSASGRQAYLAQLTYLQKRLLTAIDAIRSHATRPPVIVLQSDEGFQAEPDVFGEDVMKDIRVKGLTAVLSPGVTGLPSPHNTVNTLRWVFNHYLGTSYPMLPSASYPEGDLPYDYQQMQVRP